MKFFDFKIRGIDISKYDLSLIVSKLVGKIHFAILRIGHGTRTDPLFKRFMKLLKGVAFRLTYFYLDYYSNHMEDEPHVFGISDYNWGVRQAQNAYDNLKDDRDSWLVYLDVEQGDTSFAPNIASVWDRVETIMDGFYDTYDKLTGITNGLYCSVSHIKRFNKKYYHRPLMVAWYTNSQTRESVMKAVRKEGWTGPVHFWQFASDGNLGNGENGLSLGLGRAACDLNTWMGTEAEWENFKMADIRLNIEPLGQKDTRWRYDKLGTSASTIGGYGCLITCASMMLRYFGFDTDPGRLNKWLIANSGYHNENLFVWGSMNGYDERITFGARYNYAALDKVDAQLAKNLPVIVNVDLNPATPALDEHWVLVVGKVDGSYIINDPWTGTQFKFEEKYGSPATGMRIVCTYEFSGEIVPPAPTPEPAQIEVGKKVNTLVNLNIRKGAGTNYGVWATAPKGTQLDVLEIKGDWIRCGWNQWALSQYNGVRYLG